MIRPQIIGCGAAGNKAVIHLVESGYLQEGRYDYLLVNSTDKDIPFDYRTKSMIFGDSNVGGCGKERTLGKRMILEDEKHGIRAIDDKINPYSEIAFVIGSTEGGTGSASIPIISKYLKSVLHIPVIAVLFFGFNDDARGMQNSIEICQELSDDIGVISICNSKFMDSANGNKLKAERLANRYFTSLVRELCGVDIHESSQNIDNTDLKKVLFTPGYMTTESILLKNIKNIDQYNKKIIDTLDNENHYMESPVKSAKRIACIFNVKPDADYVDYTGSVFKDRYGIPYEYFTHVQNSGESSEYVTVIAAGQKLPTDEVKEIYEEYKRTTASINKEKDNFFEEMNAMRGDPMDSMFNMFGTNQVKSSSEKDKTSFFKEFGMDIQPQSSSSSRKKNSSEDY